MKYLLISKDTYTILHSSPGLKQSLISSLEIRDRTFDHIDILSYQKDIKYSKVAIFKSCI